MKTIAPAFIKAKREFGPALKDKTNPAFRSKYADLGACIDAVEEALLNNGIAFIQETFEDAGGITIETVFIHESGESLRCGKLRVPAVKQDAQGYGSALTYARRYSLMTACGIAPEDDDGNAASKQQTPQSKPAEQPVDTSPKARAARMTAGVANGDAQNVADILAAMNQQAIDAIWQHFDTATIDAITAVWPKGD